MCWWRSEWRRMVGCGELRPSRFMWAGLAVVRSQQNGRYGRQDYATALVVGPGRAGRGCDLGSGLWCLVIQEAMNLKSASLLAALLPVVVSLSGLAQEGDAAKKPAASQTVAQRTAGMRHLDGFLPLDWDARAGKLYL